MSGSAPIQQSVAPTQQTITPSVDAATTYRPTQQSLGGKGGGVSNLFSPQAQTYQPQPQRALAQAFQPQSTVAKSTTPGDPSNQIRFSGGLSKYAGPTDLKTGTVFNAPIATSTFSDTTFSDTSVPPPPTVISDPGGPSVFDTSTPTSGTLDTGAGTSLSYSNPGEYENAVNIQQVIADGGVNPETGDNNIVAGPNVLSASDDSFLNFGSDYNDQFQENYAAQAAHAEDNPYGQSTGTPLSEQGFSGTSYLPPPPEEDTAVSGFQGIYSGGGSDGVGNLGKIGDFFGGIGDSLGITNYSGDNPPSAPLASSTPSPNPNQAAADFHASITSGSKAQEKAESAAQVVKNKTKADFFKEFGSTGKKAEQAWINDENKRKNAAIAAAGGEQAWLNAGGNYNDGGLVGIKEWMKGHNKYRSPLGLNDGGPISINPNKKGEFTRRAQSAGMGTQAYANKVMSAPEGQYSAEVRKQANFARNASKWK